MSHYVTRGMIMPIEGGIPPFVFEWNPETINGPVNKAKYGQLSAAGSEYPILQYGHGDVQHIQFELDYSRYDNPDSFVIRAYEHLDSMRKPTIMMAGLLRPPRVYFCFGNAINKECVVVEVAPKFEKLYNKDSLEPYFAKIGVLLWHYTS